MLQQEQQRDIVAFCHLHSTFLREKKTTYTIGTLFENHHKTISFSFHFKEYLLFGLHHHYLYFFELRAKNE